MNFRFNRILLSGIILSGLFVIAFSFAAAPVIPKTASLEELVLAPQADVIPMSRLIGAPKTGEVWEIERHDGRLRVVQYFKKAPWPPKGALRTLSDILDSERPGNEIEKAAPKNSIQAGDSK